MIHRQIEAIDKAIASMTSDLKAVQRKIKNFDLDLEKQAKRKVEAEKLKRNLMDKLELNRQTIEQREQDVAIVRTSLDTLKAHYHDLATTKVDVSARKKEVDCELRHRIDQMNFTKKEYDMFRRQLKKKRGILDSVKQVIPVLEGNQQDQELILKTAIDIKHAKMEG